MSQPREIIREVDLTAAGGASPVLSVWDAPCSVPFRNLTVTISSRGVNWPANDLDWEIFYACSWASGAPFQSGSIPTEGVSKNSGTFAGAGQVFSVVYEDASLLPSNYPANPTSSTPLSKSGAGGAIIVCELTNKKAEAIKVFVTFTSEIINDTN
jgi:hypothetical protein